MKLECSKGSLSVELACFSLPLALSTLGKPKGQAGDVFKEPLPDLCYRLGVPISVTEILRMSLI